MVSSYWIAVVAGLLVALAGGIVYQFSDHQFGVIMVLGGIVVVGMGVAMRMASAFMGNKGK
jgi:hypothetical protein